MQVFISHASRDQHLAKQLAGLLDEAGVQVHPGTEDIEPGGNWAKQIGLALEQSDIMVVLFTQNAEHSDFVQKELEYALSSKNYQGRVIPVLVQPAGKVPWILNKLDALNVSMDPPNLQQGFGEVVRRVKALET
ncbi:MAG: toll/interleukin-1 receptor domain-containing protein [Bryobacterales bacterium]